MSDIHDSSSVLDKDKIYSQHQAIITIIQSKLDNPYLKSFRWLDLGCGKGQMISQLKHNLSREAINKITYYGYDIKKEYIRNVEQIANFY